MLTLRLANSLSNLGENLPSSFSLALDGTDQYVDVDDGAGELDPEKGTISTWFTFGATTVTRRICRFKASATSNAIDILWHQAASNLRIGYYTVSTYKYASFIASSIVGDGKWHHIAVTWSTSADEIKIYLDGTLKDTETGLGEFSGAINLGDIGQSTEDDTYWLGDFSEFAIFDEVIPIGSLFVADEEPIDLTGISGLVGYWRLDEGAGVIALDSSGKENPGTLKNTPSWTTNVPLKAG